MTPTRPLVVGLSKHTRHNNGRERDESSFTTSMCLCVSVRRHPTTCIDDNDAERGKNKKDSYGRGGEKHDKKYRQQQLCILILSLLLLLFVVSVLTNTRREMAMFGKNSFKYDLAFFETPRLVSDSELSQNNRLLIRLISDTIIKITGRIHNSSKTYTRIFDICTRFIE